MTVTSKEIAATPRRPSNESLSLGLALLALGLFQWVIGAKFTLDGFIVSINWLLAWVDAPGRVPALDWPIRLGLMALLGMICSVVEVRHRPARWVAGRWQADFTPAAPWWSVIAWLDFFSTLVGLVSIGPSTWPLITWIATFLPATIAVAIWLTFAPEVQLVSGWRMLTRPLR